MSISRTGTIRAAAATLSVAVATGLALVTPAQAPAATAATPGVASAGTPAAAAPGGPAGRVLSRQTVTMVTGDAAVLERLADGRQAVTVRPPADRLQIAYQSQTVKGHAYVIPSDAIPLLAAGRLDRELFDVTQLVADGYDDAHAAGTPLIVQYARGRATAASAADLPGSSRRFTLESINAGAVRESKRQAKSFWTALVSAPAAGAAASPAAAAVSRVWLDGKARVSLADSVPQIGAPQAWAAGYDGTGVKVAILDTGIDTTHPDLAGKVVAAQNFSTDTDTLDHFGHGTHVASIVAGTGAASNGLRKGVAPGASLVNAKVLDSTGSGEYSSIIEGMEWAAGQGAKVANMSLGTHAPSDGNDPLVQAVDQLSQSSGMLFAIAADNIGPGDSTITSPGWADQALTVGAVDKQDVLAGFSGRGPRLGDFGIKPDITAPGVGIIAARAAGSILGPVVDGDYMQLSGTSMAAPHVAGAAAILAQEHPGYPNQQLKDLLVSTAKRGAYTPYEQGGGRVDVARAYAQPVYASPGTLNLGFFAYPHAGQQPVSKTVTYRNGGGTGITLSLSLAVTGRQGDPAPAGMFTVSAPTVTVPAGGTASVSVTVNPAAGPIDRYAGYLVGTAGGVVVHTSVGAYLEPEMYSVTVPGIARDGRPATDISHIELFGPALGGDFQFGYYLGGTTPTLRVPPGTYSLVGYLFTMDAPNVYALQLAVAGNPQLDVPSNMTVTLDARSARKITIQTPQPSAPLDLQVGYHRELAGFVFDSSFLLGPPIREAFAVPTAQVTQGAFEFWSKWTLVAPPILMDVIKPQRIPLDPLFMLNSPPVDGTHRLPLVYVGYGRPADYVGQDVRGKIALISRGAGVTFHDKVLNAAHAGAAAAIVFNNVPGLLFVSGGDPGTVPIPSFTMELAAGQTLVGLAARGPVTVEYSGTSVSGYEYDLMLPNPGAIAASQTYLIDTDNTARIEADYRGGATTVGSDIVFALRPWTTFLVGSARNLVRPLHRIEWVNAAPDIWWWHLAWGNPPLDGEFDSIPVAYAARDHTAVSWFGQVARPGLPAGLTGWEDFGVPPYREGDLFVMNIFPYVDSAEHYGWGALDDVASTDLYQGDELLASGSYPIGAFPAVPGTADYRLVSRLQRAAPWWPYSTDVATTWTFTSTTVDIGREVLPLLQVGYQLPLDLLNRAPDRSRYTFTLDIGHPPGVSGAPISSARAWVSFNDGGAWQQIDLVRLDSGAYLATVQHPAVARTSGAVSLRVRATDTAGGSIDQTIIRAYGLRSSG